VNSSRGFVLRGHTREGVDRPDLDFSVERSKRSEIFMNTVKRALPADQMVSDRVPRDRKHPTRMTSEVGDTLSGCNVEQRNDAGVTARREEPPPWRELDTSNGLNESCKGLEHNTR
jgi:hypothetical protein